MARLSVILATVTALAVAPAQAASFAAASFNNFTITLFDLNPSDGITPRVTFSEPYCCDAGSVFVEDNGNIQGRSAVGTGPFDLNLATALSSASSRVSGTGPSAPGLVTAQGSALSPLAGRGSPSYAADAASPYFVNFTIAPATLVSFSTLATANASTTGPALFGGQSAEARVSLSAEGLGPNGTGFQSSDDSISAFAFGAARQEATTGFLFVSFTNLTGGDLAGQLTQSVLVSGFTSAIPEPETYAMMVAGLGLLGFMLRRRATRVRCSEA